VAVTGEPVRGWSFVHNMHEDANDATIVRSVIDLGRTIGLTDRRGG